MIQTRRSVMASLSLNLHIYIFEEYHKTKEKYKIKRHENLILHFN